MAIKSFRNFFAPDLVASNPAVSTIQVDIDTYDTIAELPLSGNTEGKQAFVLSNKGLYIWNGTGWYNIALLSSDLALSQGANASYTLAKDGTATEVSLAASSTNAITWTHEIVGGSLTNGGGTTATVGQVGNVFTITPTTVKDYQGTFTIKFVGTDGTAYVGSESEFVLVWLYWFGEIALLMGGSINGALSSDINYFNISTLGDSTSFGSLSVVKDRNASCSNSVYGLSGGGTSPSVSSSIEYVAFSVIGDATDFGSLSVGRYTLTASGDGTYGLFIGGTGSNVIDYVTIATPGNATSFSNLTTELDRAEACNSETYTLIAGGKTGYPTQTKIKTIYYVTTATPGNASTFGQLTVEVDQHAACSNTTYGLFSGGYSTAYTTNIDYISMATAGNASTFGNLLHSLFAHGEASNGSRAVFSGTAADVVNYFKTEYVTIATPGNATLFGDLSAQSYNFGMCSGN